ncbi:hypothetical protein HN371_29485 [Candidatus Poribacteria bacterium]|jgi:chromosome segregation ATPase|nr:hypothetical protein [Candidatus Poribacteria bacterium]MBT5714602.1 hypothetical protein [Candidatus Poribacteria bacterium]MBT7808413.1 hypothetical protein [Candidatus Poribacteria bacterium]
MTSIRAMIAAPTILIAVFTFGPVGALVAQHDMSTERLHGELQEIEHALAELDQAHAATDEQHERAGELQDRSDTIRKILADREPSRTEFQAQLEEFDRAIAKLREQDLSPEGTPDRWEVLQRLVNRRREFVASMEGRGGDERHTDEGPEQRARRLREELGDLERQINELSGERRGVDLNEKERGRMRSLRANAEEYRQALRNLDVERDEQPRRERRVEGPQEEPLRMEIFPIEHADGEALVELMLGFLPDGTRAAFDPRTSKLIVLTLGAAIEHAHYMVQELDIAVP